MQHSGRNSSRDCQRRQQRALRISPLIAALFAAVLVFCGVGWAWNRSETSICLSDPDSTSTQIEVFGLAIERFVERHSRLPIALEELLTPIDGQTACLETSPEPLDAWGNPFVYRPATAGHGHAYLLFSAGPDGVPGTSDDITS